MREEIIHHFEIESNSSVKKPAFTFEFFRSLEI